VSDSTLVLPDAAPNPPASGGGIRGFIASHKYLSIGVAAGTLYFGYKWYKDRSGSSSSSGDPSVFELAPGSTLSYGQSAGSSPNQKKADSTSSDTFTPKPTATDPLKAPYKGEKKEGSGYDAANKGGFVGKDTGDIYTYQGKAGSNNLIRDMMASNYTPWYQASPGLGTQVTAPTQVASGTDIFTISKGATSTAKDATDSATDTASSTAATAASAGTSSAGSSATSTKPAATPSTKPLAKSTGKNAAPVSKPKTTPKNTAPTKAKAPAKKTGEESKAKSETVK
jgi:hypothetical protein